jgi:hypothetical protein
MQSALVIFVLSIIGASCQTTGGSGYPTQGTFIYFDTNYGGYTVLHATEIGGSPVTTILPIPQDNIYIWNIIFNQLYNATTLIYYNALEQYFYRYDLITTSNTVINNDSLYNDFADNQHFVQHPNGTIYGNFFRLCVFMNKF